MIPALLFALVWLLGYEVVPFAHQAMHAQLGAHVHGAVAHCHGAFCHADADETDGAEHVAKQTRGSRSHGEGSLEHRGLAALAPELTIYVPELMLAGEMPREAPIVARVASFERCAPPARGPPV